MIPLTVFIFVSIQLLVVSYMDIKYKLISNIWSIINIFFFCVLTFVFPHEYKFQFKVIIFPFVFIVVGFTLFILRIMGGGDAKYLATLYLLVPINYQNEVLYYLLSSTIIIGSSLFILNLLKNLDELIKCFSIGDFKKIKTMFGQKFTFAPVIFISWMWYGTKYIL